MAFASEMGALCRDAMAETVEELTPLKQKLEDFGQFLSKARHWSCTPSCADMCLCHELQQIADAHC